MNRSPIGSMIVEVCLVNAVLTVFMAAAAMSVHAQQTLDITDGATSVIDARTGPRGSDRGGRSEAVRQGGSVDLFPGLTRANNAYNAALAAYQRSLQNYQSALAKQASIRGKYVDPATNTVRPGYDYYAAVTVVHAADVEVEDANIELQNSERLLNQARSNAAAEYRKASEQINRSNGGGPQGTRPQTQAAPESPCKRCK